MDTRWILAATLLALQPQAAAAECKAYADKLETCEPYECSFKHPFTGKPMIKKVVGLEADGNCLTHEQMPSNTHMECHLNEYFRKAVAVYTRNLQTAKEKSTRIRISGDKTEVITRLDGEVVENPLQEALDKGYCQTVMPGVKEEPMLSSPPPDSSLQHQPLKPPTLPIASKRASPAVQPGTAPMPDLAVSEVKFDVRCRPIVILENRGSRGLPASAYDKRNGAGIQLYKDGKGWQGIALFGFDRTKALMKPGGKASFTLFQPLPPDTPAKVKIVADHRNQISESTKENNTLETELRCTGGS